MNESQLHAGHRERMINRFLTYPESLNDHEILEILLYNLVPRVDTNPLAHRLIRVFGSLDDVLNATEKDLMSVKGVGHRVASGLMVIGNVFKRVKDYKKQKPTTKWINAYTVETCLRKFLKGFDTEKFIMVLLDGKFGEIYHLEFEDKSKDSVTMDVPEVVSAFIVHKPKLALVAHNHPSGKPFPSEQDDFTTYKLHELCGLYGVKLVEHMILTDKEKFSYHTSGRLDKLIQVTSPKKISKELNVKGEPNE